MLCPAVRRTLVTHPPGDVREVTTDVAVIGAGPCGITMANLLAVYGVRAVVIDAQPGIYEYPRAVGIDDESLRTFQAIGIVGRLLEDIVQNTPIRYYTSWGRLMAHVEPSVRPFGWPRRNNFLQPLFEAALRGSPGATRSSCGSAPG
jgi:3-(3-hydroxy-phenyl)propionate hydroxylase